MKYVLIQASLLVGIFFNFSCVSAKKLDTANAQIQTLSSQAESLNKQIADNQKLIGELKEEILNTAKKPRIAESQKR